ncbi:MAG: L-threonine 3-dehydrogenase, partial [Mucinivorans sp.]
DAISNGWPNSLDDSCARAEWDWSPKYDLDGMVDGMIEALGRKLL